MSTKTPSGRRRAGREAYDPSCSKDDKFLLCPYSKQNPDYDDWIEGWEEALKHHEKILKEEEDDKYNTS
jgi:ribosome modulation factor